MDERDLRIQLIRSLEAVGFVFREFLMPEGRSGQVERRRDVVGLQLGDHLQEHRQEPVCGVGGASIGRREHIKAVNI